MSFYVTYEDPEMSLISFHHIASQMQFDKKHIHGEPQGHFLLTPPPTSSNEKFNPPPRRKEIFSEWLKFTRAGVKTLRRLLFRISILVCVCVCGGGR